MKPHQPKLKTQLFSCGFFRHCAQTVLSPTGATLSPPPLPLPPPPPPPPQPQPHHHSLRSSGESSTSSSSSATSQSFTQWRFSLPTTTSSAATSAATTATPPPSSPPLPIDLQELFHLSELQLTTGSDADHAAALHLLERSLVPNPPQDQPPCPPALLGHVIRHLTATSSSSTKILFALCLSPSNRRLAVEAGAVAAVVESAPDLDGAPAERALAALELMCTVAEGAEAVRAHALAVPVMVTMMGRTGARGKEYAIGVLAVVYGGASEMAPPPEEVARAVELALQGECSVRGRRKGTQLLKTLQQLSEAYINNNNNNNNNSETHDEPK